MVEPKLKRLNQNELVQPKYSKVLNILEADNSNSYETNGNEAFQCCHAPGIVNLAFLHKVARRAECILKTVGERGDPHSLVLP